MCGGNPNAPDASDALMGLSPLVRGKLRALTAPGNAVGSIPACAGETEPTFPIRKSSRVYPRLCGGNAPQTFADVLFVGLSPLVRGKRGSHCERRRAAGSIPACAGETRAVMARIKRERVYPRLCGGNSSRHVPLSIFRGLSPLVRGKLLPWLYIAPPCGSIPACAGETKCDFSRFFVFWVYPRLCGGNSCNQHYDLQKKNGFSILIC